MSVPVDSLPDVPRAPDHAPDATQEAALDDDQERSDTPPESMAAGFAVRVTSGVVVGPTVVGPVTFCPGPEPQPVNRLIRVAVARKDGRHRWRHELRPKGTRGETKFEVSRPMPNLPDAGDCPCPAFCLFNVVIQPDADEAESRPFTVELSQLVGRGRKD